jgi:hypothetical protein
MAANNMIKTEAYAATTQTMAAAKRYAEDLAQTDDFMGSIIKAQALQELRNAIGPEVLAVIRSMEDTPLGFKTDRRDSEKKYSNDVVRDCAIQGMLDGLGFAGDLWNIIGGNYYITKSGWRKRLSAIGCTQVVVYVEPPLPSEIGEQPGEKSIKFTAPLGARASCNHNGKQYAVSMTATAESDTRRIVSATGKDFASAMTNMSGKVEATILRKLYYMCCDLPWVDEPEPEGVTEPVAAPIMIERIPDSTQEQREMYDKCIAELQAADNVKALAETWKAINELQKNGGITQGQLATLTTAKDARKKILSAG